METTIKTPVLIVGGGPVGLSMAIPFAVMHSLLETRLNHIVAGVEDVIARVFTTELDIGQADTSQRA